MALPDPSDSSTALITGASSGIGAAIARELAGRGHGAVVDAVRELGLDVAILVNNAGFGGFGALNVASTASFQPLPGSATYAATKAFVLSLSEATHAELKGHGVTVTALCPGPVRTEFGVLAGGKRVVVPGLLNRAGAVGGQHVPRAVILPAISRAYRQVF